MKYFTYVIFSLKHYHQVNPYFDISSAIMSIVAIILAVKIQNWEFQADFQRKFLVFHKFSVYTRINTLKVGIVLT